MHPLLWAALGAAAAAPVVMVATLLGALLVQVMFPTAFQLKSLARQKRLGPRKGVTSGDPVHLRAPGIPACCSLPAQRHCCPLHAWLAASVWATSPL